VRLSRRPALLPVDELLRRLGELERRLQGGGAPPGAGSAPMDRRGPPQGGPPPAAPRRPMGMEPAPPVEPARAPAALRPPEASRAPAPPPAQPPPAAAPPAPTPAAPPAPRAFAAPAASAPPPPPRAPSAPPPAALPPPGAPDLGEWRRVVESLRARKPALASVLEHAALLELGPERVVLGYEQGSFLAAQVADPAALELARAAVRAHFGRPTELVFELAASRAGAVTMAQVESAERKARIDAAKTAVASHPLVTAAIAELGAELRDVKLSQDALDG
jgi:DNA polymerase-3 subunit gamma/tau